MPDNTKNPRKPKEEKITALKERIRNLEKIEAKHERVEEELRKKESFMRAINDSALDAIIMMDPEGKISYWNPASVRIFGYTSEEALGQDLHGLLAPEYYKKRFEESFPEFQRSGEGPGVGNILQLEAIGKNGVEFPIELSLSSVHLNDGWHSVGIVRDITDNIQTEKELRERREWLQDFTNEIPAMVCEFLPDSKLTYVNKAFCEFFGMSSKELLGKRFLDLLPENDREIMKQAHMSLSPQTPSITGINQAFAHDGIRIAEWQDRAFFDEHGRIKKLQGIGIDVTEREQAKRELQQSEEKFRSYIENTPLGVFEADMTGRYIKVNPAACEITGYTEEEFLNMSIMDLLDPEYLDAGMKIFEKVKKIGQDRAEIKLRKKSGERFWINIVAVKIHESIVAFCQDITEQRQAKEDLKVQLGFEKLVADISNIFVRLPSERIHEAIDYTLEQTGKFFHVDRCYIFLFSRDGARMSNTHEWCAEGVESQINNIQDQPIESLPWWAEQIRKNELVHVPDVDSLPPEAEAEWKEFKSQSIQSLLSIPLTKEEKVLGFLGMDSVKGKKVWTKDNIILLRAMAELISNAYTRYQAEQEIQYLTFHDSLTGLYNRYYLENEMARLDTKRQLPIGIVMADLNNFKLVNDISGHKAGDEMLKYTAETLRNSCRSEDIIVRWGGDEFVILLPQTTEEDAKTICNRIKENFKPTYIQGSPVSLAMGYAIKESPETDMAEILKTADENMYTQKVAVKSKKNYTS